MKKSINIEESKILSDFENIFQRHFMDNNFELLLSEIIKFKTIIEKINNKGAGYYDIALAYSALNTIKPVTSNEGYIEDQLYYYRKAIAFFDNNKKYDEENARLKIYTNYANALFNVGRIISACRYYRKALLINHNFYMAIGNYGMTLHALAMYANQKHGSNINIDHNAYKMIKKAYNSKNDYEVENSGARNEWNKALYEIENSGEYFEMIKKCEEIKLVPIEGIDQYKNWCLINHLCLDIESEIRDYNLYYLFDELYIPGLNKEYYKMFEQLIDDYCYGRYHMYLLSGKLYDTHIQDIRSIFNILYSIIDKCAYFINSYYKIGIENRNASASNVFCSEEFMELMKNSNGLTSIKYTYNEFKEKYGESNNAFYRDLYDIRNGFEHRYVFINSKSTKNKKETDLGNYSISINRLYDYSYELLLIAREIIMYLYISLDNESLAKHYGTGL